jgi:hypothetical protein
MPRRRNAFAGDARRALPVVRLAPGQQRRDAVAEPTGSELGRNVGGVDGREPVR